MEKNLLAYFLVTTPTSSGIIAAIKVLLYNCFSVLDPYNGNRWGPGKGPGQVSSSSTKDEDGGAMIVSLTG